jgi:pimeloyl-ACP methyl ester carboxylesterase
MLISGLGMQLNCWPTEFCELLADRGYHVVRFDNRDAGRSTHLGFPPPRPFRMATRRWHPDQYDLADMAADTAGLLEALGLAGAHLVGISMGGMIAQTVAARYPGKTWTLTSIMSMTGARRVGRPAPSTWLLMLARPPRDRAEFIDRDVRIFRHIGSAGFPFDEAGVRALAAQSWDRDSSGGTAGTARQLAAIFKSGDRTAEVGTITAPTLVIHGDRDLMVNPTGGARTAQTIAGARLETIKGMGHDLPRDAWPVLVDLIDAHIRATEPRTATGAPTATEPRTVTRSADGQES